MASGTIKPIMYKTVNLTGADTNVTANGTTTINLSGTIPSGYAPIGIISADSGNTYISIEGFSITYMRVHNNATMTKVCTPSVKAICVPSSFVS